MTPHIESKKEDIAEIVLMPGDPLRAKYIAEKYLTEAKLINKIRNMFGYTGFYKGKRVTVFASGMGIPSIGIYAYELFNFYDVKKIIRIGSSGSFNPNIKVGDLVLATSSRSITSFDSLVLERDLKEIMASQDLNEIIQQTGQELDLKLNVGKIITSDNFDNFLKLHEEGNYLATEMESFGLFALAQKLNKEASCLLTVVDTHNSKEEIPAKDREKALDDMIKLALEAIIK